MALMMFFLLAAAYAHTPFGIIHPTGLNQLILSDSVKHNQNIPTQVAARPNQQKPFAGSCYDVNWATWTTFDNVTSTTGLIINADGSPLDITMSANYSFGSTPSIYTYSRFSGYPANIPNSTVPKTTWAAGAGGVTTMCFSKKVTNPVLLLSSLGSSLPQSSTLDFSIPYVVLYDGGGMVYDSSTRLTGTEGYAIIMFPGDFTCVTINSSTPEFYTNLTWGIRPQPFPITITDNSTTCTSATVTASGGVSYKWNGGDTPNQASNTFHQSGTYLVTVTNSVGCITSASKAITINTALSPEILAFSISQQIGPANINVLNKTISLTMPPGTNLASLNPLIAVTSGATIAPASGTAQNFATPVAYTVTGCSQVIYTATVVDAKASTTCSGVATTLPGDLPTPTGTYNWQILQGNAWVNAPGTTNTINYQTSALINNTPANVVFNLRRQITSGNVIIYDSYYQFTVQPSVPISNNTIAAPAVTAFCSTGDPSVIIGSTPAGGNGVFNYQWQSSSDGITYFNVTGAILKDYDPAVVIATTYYQRIVTSGICNTPITSNSIQIKVTSPVSNNGITAPAVISFCSSGTPSTIIGSTPAGGNGTFTYQWQSTTDGNTYIDITGATAKDYTPGALTSTTYFRRSVLSGACTAPFSNVVQITIVPAISNNIVTPPSIITFCSTGNPASITGSTPTGGNGIYQYQWQSSADNLTFGNIAGAINKDYDPPVINVTTYYRRGVTSGVCTVPATSNTILINILSFPASAVLTPATPVCIGSSASLSIKTPDASLTYNWYDSATKNNLLFSGPSYTTGPLNGNKIYYVEATNGSCANTTLTSITVTIVSPPAAPVLNKNSVSVCAGSPATLDISNPQATLTYKWYTGATGGTPVFTGSQFSPAGLATNTTYYAEAVNNTGCASPRTVANITTLNAPAIAAQGASICAGTSTMLTATSTDNNVTIKWYTSSTGGSSIFTGAAFPTTTINAASTYYAEATNNASGCISASRAPAAIQLISPLAAPVVSTGEVTGTSVSFKWASVPGATGYQVSIDNGQTFVSPSSGSAGLTHTISGLANGQTISITVRATGASVCQVSAKSVSVAATAINPAGDQIYVANAFTPNGDGNNDVVYVHSENMNTVKFYVYDQWGEMLFASANKQNGWDGSYKGQQEPAGVYVYYVQAVMLDGKQVNKKGTITLIR